MQRAAFPELQGRPRPPRHRRPEKPDGVLRGLKIATFVAALGVLGVVVLLTTSSPSKPAARANPPKVVTGQVGDDAPRQQPPTSVQPVVEPPALRTETAEITRVPTSKPPTSTPSTKPPKPPKGRPPVVGEPCPQQGMWAMTDNFEPVVCYGDSPPRWRKVF
jgi:hypothetical protein